MYFTNSVNNYFYNTQNPVSVNFFHRKQRKWYTVYNWFQVNYTSVELFSAKKLIKMLINIKSEISCQQVSISGEWIPWTSKVPVVEVETHKVAAPDVVIPTVDTVRHEALLYTWLAEHKPLVLCGPPGSGKTMTLFSALRSLPDMEVNIFPMFTWTFY